MQTFTKAERLSSKTLIDSLIENGKSFSSAPFRITWQKVEEAPVPVQVLLSVPKRIYKRAVDRNLLKRRMREAYRKQKNELYDHLGKKNILLMIVFTSAKVMEYKEMEEKIREALQRLKEQIDPVKK